MGAVAVEARVFRAPCWITAVALRSVWLQRALSALTVEVPDAVRCVSEELVTPGTVRFARVAEHMAAVVVNTTTAFPPSAVALEASARPELGDLINGWHAAASHAVAPLSSFQYGAWVRQRVLRLASRANRRSGSVARMWHGDTRASLRVDDPPALTCKDLSGRRESNPHDQLGRCTASMPQRRWPADLGIRGRPRPASIANVGSLRRCPPHE
jgi:hypothetical protein